MFHVTKPLGLESNDEIYGNYGNSVDDSMDGGRRTVVQVLNL